MEKEECLFKESPYQWNIGTVYDGQGIPIRTKLEVNSNGVPGSVWLWKSFIDFMVYFFYTGNR